MTKTTKMTCRVLALVALITALSVLTVTALSALGDVNSDGVVNTVDVRLMLRHILKGEPFTVDQQQLADVDGDGVVDTQDVRDVLETLARQSASTSAPRVTTSSATVTATTTTTTTIAATTTTTVMATTTTVIATATTATELTLPTYAQVEPFAIHEYEMRMFEMINEERAKAGVAPLRFAYEDYQCVKLRAAEQNIIFGHVRPNGERAKSVYTDFGMDIPAVGGENVVKYAFSPEDGMDGFMTSPGHKANILNPDYTAVSVGMDYTPEGLLIFAQLFKQ